jgi:nitrite reductase/ring-hydroxylating ferredoxin subunit
MGERPPLTRVSISMSAESFPQRRPAPRGDLFPEYPASWYLLCAARRLRDRPFSRTILGRRLIAFRTASGRIAVLGAHCAHQGADLGRGIVVGETIQCPYHHWRYAADGLCAGIPDARDIPRFARQPAYPAVERHGYVFFFNGNEALFPLPFFPGEDPGRFVAGRPFTLAWEYPWYMIVANAFDIQHFRAVHDRRMIGDERLDSPAPFARRIRFEAEVAGGSIYDRALRVGVGDRVEIEITNWGGPFVTVKGRFRRATSYIVIVVQPLDRNRALTDALVFAPRRGVAALWLRRLFTRGFIGGDLHRLSGIQYNPDTFIETDHVMVEFLHWLASLPRVKEGPE